MNVQLTRERIDFGTYLGAYLTKDLNRDGYRSNAKEPFNMKFVWQAALDYKVWCASKTITI